MQILKKIKKTNTWKFFLKFFLTPLFEFIWKNIINIHGRILYFLYFFKKKREFFSLDGNDKKIVENPQITKLANKIKENCTKELINNSKEKVLKNLIEENNKTNSFENKYKFSLLDEIDPNLKKEIIDFGMSELLLSTAAKHLKVFPILGKVALYLNMPTPDNEKARGAMLWHKDDFGYKSLDFFIIITDIDDTNGPLFVLNKKLDLGVFQRILNEKINPVKGERGKIEDNIFFNLFSNDEIKLSGSTGKTLLIDSFTAYHKGGHCLSNDRIMLRYSYQTVDCVRLPKIKNNQFSYSENIKKDKVLDVFHRFLLFKRSYFLNILNIRGLLLKFYRFVGHRI